MKALIVALCLCVSTSAGAADVVLGATGGWDYPSDQFWTGLQLAVHANQAKGFGWSARLEPGFNPLDKHPVVMSELGVQMVVPSNPEENVVIRTGLTARAVVPFVTYPLPLRAGEVGDVRPGLIPALLWNVDFSWQRRFDSTLGIRAGGTSVFSAFQCAPGEPLDQCATWYPGFTAGFYGRMAFKNHLALELLLGHQTQLMVGYRF